MILFILIGVLVTVLLAIAIVKFVPVKLTPVISAILLAAAGFLSYKIYDGIMEPIRFHQEKKVRYAKVIKQLKMIRDAEDAHKTITGSFTANGENLIKFIDTAKFPIIDTHTIIVEENKGTKWQPIMVEVEKKVTDTIGYESVKKTLFTGRDYHAMLAIPDTNEQFKIETSQILRSNKTMASVFEVRVDKRLILSDLSKSLVKQEREALGGDDVPGPYIAVGSLNEVSTTGNWPPFYEQLSE